MSYQDKLNYLINSFGGADNFQKLLGVGPSAISNYKSRKHLPLSQAKRLSKIAPQFGFSLDPHSLLISASDKNKEPEILIIITMVVA